MSLTFSLEYELIQEKIRERLLEASRDRLADRSRELPIPKLFALRLCREIRDEHLSQQNSPGYWRCAICLTMARNDIPTRLVPGRPGSYYDGCPIVNRRYLKKSVRYA